MNCHVPFFSTVSHTDNIHIMRLCSDFSHTDVCLFCVTVSGDHRKLLVWCRSWSSVWELQSVTFQALSLSRRDFACSKECFSFCGDCGVSLSGCYADVCNSVLLVSTISYPSALVVQACYRWGIVTSPTLSPQSWSKMVVYSKWPQWKNIWGSEIDANHTARRNW